MLSYNNEFEYKRIAAFQKHMKNITDIKQRYLANLYLNLFAILSYTEFEEELKQCQIIASGKDKAWGKEGKTGWFSAFHKTIRQIDYFHSCIRKMNAPTLTNEEDREYRFLLNKVRQKDYVKVGENGELFNSEYSRFLDLNDLKRRENTEESIGGYIDNVLYGLINLDTENVLYNAIKATFSVVDKKTNTESQK